MRIPLGNGYAIRSDALNFWITKERAAQKTGKTYEETVSGYYRNIPDLIENYIDRHIGTSEAESLKELAADIRKLKRTVSRWKKCVTLEQIIAMEKEHND